MASPDKPLAWLHGEIKTPPFTAEARIEAGVLLRRLQRGDLPALPHSRPMPAIGRQCHEFRIPDETKTWRIVYHLSRDAVAILEIFGKKTRKTPSRVIAACQRRLDHYQSATARRREKT